jgi:hypothetical protein
MAKQKRLKCSMCDRRFSMPAHLARHMNTAHGSGKPKVGAARKGRKAGRRRQRATGVPTTGLDFAGLSLAQLCGLIDLARAEAKRRLDQF